MTDTAIVSTAPPPGEAFSILKDAHVGEALSQAPGLAGTKQVSVSPPIQLFRLSFADLQNPDPLPHAHPGGWQYLLWRPDAGRRKPTPIAVADLTNDADRGLELTGLHRQKFAQALARASEIAESKAETAHDHWEARVLEVPSIHLTALWLLASQGPAEIFVLLHPGAGSAQEITNIRSEIARRVQAKQSHLDAGER